nr:immunoglobulin light chain junction region [Macaca mulatta]
FMQGTQLWTF